MWLLLIASRTVDFRIFVFYCIIIASYTLHFYERDDQCMHSAESGASALKELIKRILSG